jgi:uncharacterized protein (DUF1330 family)
MGIVGFFWVGCEKVGIVKFYAVAELNVTNRRWVPSYVRNVTKIVERRGGRYLARTVNLKRVEGDRELPQLFLIIEWPSREAAEEFYESDEYRPYRDARLAGSTGQFVLVSGEDVNRIADIPQ